jgi:hypothetical protein
MQALAQRFLAKHIEHVWKEADGTPPQFVDQFLFRVDTVSVIRIDNEI